MKNIKPTQKPHLRAGGECHRETVHRVPKMACTHALISVTLSPICRRQRGQAAEKTHVARWRQPDGITTSLVLPSSMRVSVPQQCLSDPLPHGTPRALTGHCEYRPTGTVRRGNSAFTPLWLPIRVPGLFFTSPIVGRTCFAMVAGVWVFAFI
ncbi:hypothetical protein TcCL_Unassigned01622 [Trypanosoma cruzi]|nr:hypothetical protein TcCL_Unassigned01622 [Trypanosoma cruzi]